MLPDGKMVEALLPAFTCPHFGSCRQAIFAPEQGHIPRGFLGATGDPHEVEAVFIFSEPGHPHATECYPSGPPIELLAACVRHTYSCFRDSTDLFHRNVRSVMNELWPGKGFDEQLRHVWLTEGRLCSIEQEIGGFNDRLCAPTHLLPQLRLLRNAVIVPFGTKANHRFELIRQHLPNLVIPAAALAPPGANKESSKATWAKAIEAIQRQRAVAEHT